MQRYHVTGCSGAVNSGTVGGSSVRDTARAESSSLSTNFSLNSRQQLQLTAYKLKCDKEPLNARLGPPDFHPQSQNCPEETLTRENVQHGYKETIDGLEDSKEISLTQVQSFSKPVVLKCKDAIRKCLRAINESRAQKRKAGQVYGVPLSDLLISKPGIFPEQRPCSEDFRKKWIEALSQQHKRLRSLADHVPHGYRKKALFEALIKNNVPLLRATWFIKVTYLSQIRPGSSAISSGVSDKCQLSRSELWTKDVIDYLQNLLDEFFSKSNSHSTPQVRDRLAHAICSGSVQIKNDYSSSLPDSEEPSLHSKWWYVVRLLQWHHSEGLLLSSLIIDWVLNQLEEKELFEILQLMLPIIYGVLETITLSQTYVRTLVGIATRFIHEPSPGGSDLVDNSRRAYTSYALVEMLRYLIQAVPDTFVALDCFPFPSSVISHGPTDGGFALKALENAGKIKNNSADISGAVKGKLIDSQYQALSFDHVVSTIQRRTDTLAKAASVGYPTQSMAKAVQALDNTLLNGDLKDAYKHIFEDLCSGVVGESWISEVSPCLRSSLQWIGTVSSSFISSIFLLCEWATCDFRDFRSVPPQEMKFTGQGDFSQVYVAIHLLKLKSRESENTPPSRQRIPGVNNIVKNQQNTYIGRTSTGNTVDSKSRMNNMVRRNVSLSNLFESPGPLHDIIVCWIDQHEVHRGEGIKCLQLFVLELIHAGIFYPQAYVRQLIVSGLIDTNSQSCNLNRRKRHYCILKQLPARFLRDVFVEAGIAQGSQISEAVKIYSSERRLVIRGLVSDQSYNKDDENALANKQRHSSLSAGENAFLGLGDQWKAVQLSSSVPKKLKREVDPEELKTSISVFLQLPSSYFTSVDTGMDESQGSAKRTIGSVVTKFETAEGTPGCEDCRRAKKQKLSEDKSSCLKVSSPLPSDDEDNWWVRKGPKSVESFKVDPPLKSTKQTSRGRQKTVRKTQSLAQLAAARIEGSQEASTSHVCDNKMSCPHHRTEVETPKTLDGARTVHSGDIVSIGQALKKLRPVDKRGIVAWLISVVKQVLEESGRTVSKVGPYSKPFSTADDKSSCPWKLGEDELSAILYVMDVCDDLPSAVRFIVWLLPKVLNSSTPTIHGRNIVMLPKNIENQTCEVGEAFLLSSLRRYENILIAADLVPEVLSATTQRAATLMVSSGRISGSASLVYARHLLKRYGNVASVVEWEKTSKATYDKRLLSELNSGRSLEGESGFPLGVPAGVEDVDEYLRQKLTGGRLSRVGVSMRDIVQRHIEEVIKLGKDRKFFSPGAPKGISTERWEDNYFIAQQIIMGLMELIKQTGGAAQEGDPSLVSSAVSAIVSSVGPSIAKLPDFTAGNNYSNYQSSTSLLNFARRILRIHLTCLCLLKEALGERQSRVFDIALMTEASSAIAGSLAPGKSSRTQFQVSSEALDSSTNISSDILNSSTKVAVGRTRIAAVSALVIGAIIHGITSLERIVTVLRLKEGLDVVQFVRTTRTSSNGNARSAAPFKVDNSVEVCVHWFRLLIGNCRTVLDGFVAELLGEPSVLALLRMHRLLPVKLVFPPAYAIFAFVIWKPFVLNRYIAGREDIHQLYQSLTSAIGDAIKHLPFRDVCMRDSQGLYDSILTDSTDVEFASMLESNGLDGKSKSSAFVPLRARLFLNAMIDCKMAHTSFLDEGNRTSAHGESIPAQAGNGSRLVDKLVNVLDTLQPAKFHWQWVELRLLLNEQAIIEKLEDHELSLVDALRSSSPCSKEASENEKHFIEIILTRLLVRPDAASLFSELVHLFGRSLEDIVLRQAKWFLAGSDVLLGRKTIRQRLINIAESKGLPTKAQFRKPWGWSFSGLDPGPNRREKKFEVPSIEEGEVVEEGMEPKRYGKGSSQIEAEESSCSQHVTEKAFVELVLPCIDQSSDESGLFANDLIKQLYNIEQQIGSVTRSATKQAGTPSSGNESSGNKSTNRKGIRGGSPGMTRRSTAIIDSAPPSPLALRASMSLRMQFVLRLLPFICAHGEPSARNMRHTLASVILRLLGSRVVYEDLNLSFCPTQPKREVEMESPPVYAELCGENLFDLLLLVLHGLLGSSQPSWLRSRAASKPPREFSKSFSGLDREAAENLQNELDAMQLPDTIRWRIQTAMPVLCSSVRYSVSCQPPTLPIEAISSVQPSSVSLPGTLNPPQRSVPTTRSANMVAKQKSAATSQDFDMEIDPWTLLEDGAGSGPSSSSTAALSSDHNNLRAVSWLKGAVRVRRTDLTYIGAVDDDS